MTEVQDIFAAHFEDYAAGRKLSSEQWKAARSLILCRTAALGAHVDVCDHCGYHRIVQSSSPSPKSSGSVSKGKTCWISTISMWSSPSPPN